MRVCLVVRPGVGDAGEVAAAVRRHATAPVQVTAVWGGDPHLRPLAPTGTVWIDRQLPEPSGVGWNRLLLALPGDVYALARAMQAVARQPSSEAGATLVLVVGRAAVCADVSVSPLGTGAVGAIVRTPILPPADGLGPTPADVAGAGRYSAAALWVGPDAGPAAAALAAALVAAPVDAELGPLWSAALDGLGTPVAAGPGLAAGWATLPDSGVPAVIDVESVGWTDAHTPRLDTPGGPPRHSLADAPALVAALTATAAQWPVGEPEPLTLPGGIAVDDVVRGLVADAIARWRRGAGPLPPEPYGPEGADFVAWLESPWPPWGPDVGRYWNELWHRRTDLIEAFPEPAGADRAAFTDWAAESWHWEPRSVVLRPVRNTLRPPWHSTGHAADGVNVVGYLGFDNSIADVARRAVRCLDAAGVPVAALDYRRSGSPRTNESVDLTDEVRYTTTLAFVNADQFPLLDGDYGSVLWPGRRTIAYWFWELAYVPPRMVAALEHVDELWVGSEFVAGAFRAVTDTPVRTVPIPVPEPHASRLGRADLGLPLDRFVFLVTFDHLSVTERKNPLGAIEAFRRAFPDPQPGGPVLLVKSLNRDHRREIHDRLRLAAAGRDDIVVVDRHLDRADQMALIREADCLVSLHRSEGLGLHLLEAMWLRTPTIATRYSGNVDFMNDGNSALVDATLVGVTNGEGYLPEEGVWADPDLDQAAAWMRRMASEPELRERLVNAGRATVEGQPTPAAAGAEIARLAGVHAKIGAA